MSAPTEATGQTRERARPLILLVGGTGNLGARIARRLADREISFRALVRPGTDHQTLHALGAEVVRGDLRDRESLDRALIGIRTVVSTAHSLDRIMAGSRDVTIASVDREGNRNLVEAAEAAGVDRFVFVSFPTVILASHTPFAQAKLATEALLQRSKLHEVIVRPTAYQEQWLSTERRFDWQSGVVTIFGTGNGLTAYVGMEDVAEGIVRLATIPDPPRLVEFGGPEAMSRNQLADAFERALGRPIRRRHVPRIVLRIGSLVLRPFRPGLASVMGMALAADGRRDNLDDRALRELGIRARPVSAYIADLVAAEQARSSRPA